MNYKDFITIGLMPEMDSAKAEESTEMRIATSLLAFAAGDAIGVEYEIQDTKKPVQIERMGTRADWPFGGVSDDTLLSLITIQTFAETTIDNARVKFLENLKTAVPNLRGLGPTTRFALGIAMPPELMAMVGNTNGGLMRTSLIGLAYPNSRAKERRAMVLELATATHQNLIAAYAAVLTSALFSEALEDNPRSNFDVLRSEVDAIPNIPNEFKDFIKNYDSWQPPQKGITLESLETLRAVTWAVDHAKDCLDAYRISCEFGGDTDTVAAQAGALICAQSIKKANFYSIPWLKDISWGEIDTMKSACETLINYRSK
jgi:ADP-ribosylglycohydrolase